MRSAMLLIAVFLVIPTAFAYTLTSTATPGSEPAIHGDRLAFLTFEDAVDKDLNNDGDMADNVIQHLKLRDLTVVNTGKEAKHFSLHGSVIAFEDKSRTLWLLDLATNKATDLTIRGTLPSLGAKRMAFTTPEDAVGIDLNNDNDKLDMIIQYYTKETNTTTNTKTIGANPLLLDDYLVFETAETLAGQDLNNDSDRDDTIIRAWNFMTNRLVNTKIAGKNPVGLEDNTIVVNNNNKLVLLDLSTNQPKPLDIAGNDPSFYNNAVVYERNGVLYSTMTGGEKSLGIAGKEPALYDNTLVFIGENKTIMILRGEDPDTDAVPDFLDNCLNTSNADQADADKNGVGDVCETNTTTSVVNATTNTTTATNTTQTNTTPSTISFTTQSTPPAPQPVVAPAPPVTAEAAALELMTEPVAAPRKSLPDAVVLQNEKDDDDDADTLYWFLIAVGLAVIGVILLLVVPRWLNRRKKSYGF